jgi:predicted nucleic acid-binding Zn ribbon protein
VGGLVLLKSQRLQKKSVRLVVFLLVILIVILVNLSKFKAIELVALQE